MAKQLTLDPSLLPDALKRLRDVLLAKEFVPTQSEWDPDFRGGEGYIRFMCGDFDVVIARECSDWLFIVDGYTPREWRAVLDSSGPPDDVMPLDKQVAFVEEHLDQLLPSPPPGTLEALRTARSERNAALDVEHGWPPALHTFRDLRAALDVAGVDRNRYTLFDEPEEGQYCIEWLDHGCAVYRLENGVRTQEERFDFVLDAYKHLFSMLVETPTQPPSTQGHRYRDPREP